MTCGKLLSTIRLNILGWVRLQRHVTEKIEIRPIAPKGVVSVHQRFF